MSHNMEPIKPFVTEEGIQLYDIEDFRGMSQAGLGRFCGVAESKAANDTARCSLAKFAAMGIDSWIRNVTGHEQPAALAIDPRDMVIQLLMEKSEWQDKLVAQQVELTVTIEKLLEKEQDISRAVINAPGLSQVLEDDQESELLLLSPAETKETYTLLEWLEYCKYPIPDKMYRQFRLKVAGFFESLRHYTPKKEYRPTKSGNQTLAYVYTIEDFHFLDAVFMQVSASYRP